MGLHSSGLMSLHCLIAYCMTKCQPPVKLIHPWLEVSGHTSHSGDQRCARASSPRARLSPR
ncbi:hypothetical protein XHV734_0434 [Xanthomonas hortorum pv. vitians]|nr:hypothetical protein XHV734_0434 [Xanthomonas hortorum pv. vitians]